MRKQKLLVALLFIFLTGYVFMSRDYLGSLVHPLPFEGPYHGVIFDALTERPIKDATVLADWWCYDSPDPHLGNYWVHVSVNSDDEGRYRVKKPNRRGGWFGGSFTLSVNAKGYVPVVLALMPNGPALPPETEAYPFIDTRVFSSFPASLDIRLNPFRPVLLEALLSEKADYRQHAARELGKMGREAGYVVDPLIHRLKDGDAAVRIYSAEALGMIGPDARAAIPALTETLHAGDGGCA